MNSLSPDSEMERSIQQALLHSTSIELAADRLIAQFENVKLNRDQFQIFAQFLLKAGFFASLAEFCLRKLDDDSEIPWAHFAEAYVMAAPHLEIEIKKTLIEGAELQRSSSQLSRTHVLDAVEPEIEKWRASRRDALKEALRLREESLWNQVEVFRSQNLAAEEESALIRIQRITGLTPAIEAARRALREKRALEFISKTAIDREQSHKEEPYFPEINSEETQKHLQQIVSDLKGVSLKAPEWQEDLGVALLMMEQPEAGLEVLGITHNRAARWIRAELLLRSRRFLELQHELDVFEKNEGAAEADVIFAINYLRAQALWGLNQKHAAIALMESLLQLDPEYRAGDSLLQEWKGHLS